MRALGSLADSGGCVVGRFRAVGPDRAKEFLLASPRIRDGRFFQEFLSSAAVRGELAELNIPESLALSGIDWEQVGTGALTFDGVLAQLLVSGGGRQSALRSHGNLLRRLRLMRASSFQRTSVAMARRTPVSVQPPSSRER
jgi:hypothetical protein